MNSTFPLCVIRVFVELLCREDPVAHVSLTDFTVVTLLLQNATRRARGTAISCRVGFDSRFNANIFWRRWCPARKRKRVNPSRKWRGNRSLRGNVCDRFSDK